MMTVLCQRGLAIRGDDKIIASVRNGNYLGTMDLLSENDNFSKQHP